MSLLSRIADFWSDRLTTAAAARRLGEQIRTAMPDLPWTLDAREPRPTLELPGRMRITLEDHEGGVQARIVEPGQPGDDDPPLLLRAGYDITNLVHHLSWRARLAPGTVALHALRVNAVYEIVHGFADHHGTAFAAGTRLTFVQRHFLPYHGGHTLCFREGTIYLQEESDVCRRFEHYFAVAESQEPR